MKSASGRSDAGQLPRLKVGVMMSPDIKKPAGGGRGFKSGQCYLLDGKLRSPAAIELHTCLF